MDDFTSKVNTWNPPPPPWLVNLRPTQVTHSERRKAISKVSCTNSSFEYLQKWRMLVASTAPSHVLLPLLVQKPQKEQEELVFFVLVAAFTTQASVQPESLLQQTNPRLSHKERQSRFRCRPYNSTDKENCVPQSSQDMLNGTFFSHWLPRQTLFLLLMLQLTANSHWQSVAEIPDGLTQCTLQPSEKLSECL